MHLPPLLIVSCDCFSTEDLPFQERRMFRRQVRARAKFSSSKTFLDQGIRKMCWGEE